MSSEIRIAKKRILGAAFFGIILSGFMNAAFRLTVPEIMAMIQDIDISEARMIYESSPLMLLLISVVITLAVALVAAYLSRRNGIVTALLANSIFIIIGASLFLSTTLRGTDVHFEYLSPQLYLFIALILILTASIGGGYLGQRLYSPENDLDLDSDRLTVFGIRWYHYFWILPIIIYPFLISLIMVVYATVLMLLSHIYFVIHPSLWLSIGWWIYFFGVPIGIYFACWVVFGGFYRFMQVMQYSQSQSKGWKKFGQVLLFGLGAPILSYGLGALGARITHNLPKPASGDWKILVIIIIVLIVISAIYSLVSRITQR